MGKTARAAKRRSGPQRPRFTDIAAEFEREERAAGRYPRGYHLDSLREFFGRRPIADIDPASIRAYARGRQGHGESNDRINEELKLTLVPLLHFAKNSGKLKEFPRVEFLSPSPAEPGSPGGASPRIARLLGMRSIHPGLGEVMVDARVLRAMGGSSTLPSRHATTQDGQPLAGVSDDKKLLTDEILATFLEKNKEARASGVHYRILAKRLKTEHGVSISANRLGRRIRKFEGQSVKE